MIEICFCFLCVFIITHLYSVVKLFFIFFSKSFLFTSLPLSCIYYIMLRSICQEVFLFFFFEDFFIFFPLDIIIIPHFTADCKHYFKKYCTNFGIFASLFLCNIFS
nr:MAG TPA: hypothetical protein [Caudoviricetes sp.]